MDEQILDRPVWSTLTSIHAPFALGEGNARRFQADISPLAAAQDESAESLADLASLIAVGESAIVVQRAPIVCPAGLDVTQRNVLVQMLFEGFRGSGPGQPMMERLGDADAAEMLALATLTRPGPFLSRTHLLGEFRGIKREGRLIAMAGERMKQPGFTEISGVCTHPDFQGQGLAAALCVTLLRRITDRGEVPYLHTFADNSGAIRLYEKLGFRLRTRLHLAQMQRS